MLKSFLIQFLIMILMLSLLFNIMKFTKKKLVTLMMLELLMFCLILVYSIYQFSLKMSFFFLIFLSIFMVLDSVFGICTLIANSRSGVASLSTKILF